MHLARHVQSVERMRHCDLIVVPRDLERAIAIKTSSLRPFPRLQVLLGLPDLQRRQKATSRLRVEVRRDALSPHPLPSHMCAVAVPWLVVADALAIGSDTAVFSGSDQIVNLYAACGCAFRESVSPRHYGRSALDALSGRSGYFVSCSLRAMVD